MRKLTPWARALWYATVIAKALTTAWGAAVVTAMAMAAAALVWMQQPSTITLWQASLFTFVGVLWAVVAVVWLATRQTPTIVATQRDYRYRLDYGGLRLGFDEASADAAVQIGIALRNCSPHPLKYRMILDDLAVVLGDTTVPFGAFESDEGIMPPTGSRVFWCPAFKKAVVENRKRGQIKFQVVYGHPDDQPTRTLRMKINFTVRLDDRPAIVDLIISEFEKDYVQ